MTVASPFPELDYRRRPLPAAAFEILICLTVVATFALAFVAGYLSVNGAIIITVLLLLSLIALSWIHLGQGRHPAFLFLCTLTLFQGGRLIAFCLGQEPDPLRVTAMESSFVLARQGQGLVLLCLVLSAICVYAPCRWTYKASTWIGTSTLHYLPYLYIVFLAALPAQLYKGYNYYQYAMAHGGYLFLYVDHSALATTVPFWVRVISAVAPVAFVALFVTEPRPKRVALTTLLYFICSLPVLLLGSRMGAFSLLLSLFFVWRVKSGGDFRFRNVVLLGVALTILAGFFGSIRSDYEAEQGLILPLEFVRQQGISLNVTEVSIRNPDIFRPYWMSYLYNEIQAAFVGSGAYNRARGRMWDVDISNFLDPLLYRYGFGLGGSYVGEAYTYWGLTGVIVVSLTVGLGLAFLTKISTTAVPLILVALTLPDIYLMPRGSLIGWASVLARNLISISILLLGWQLYSLLVSIRHRSASAEISANASGAQ